MVCQAVAKVKGDKLFSGLDNGEGTQKEEQDVQNARCPRAILVELSSVRGLQLSIWVSGSGEVTGWSQSLGEK